MSSHNDDLPWSLRGCPWSERPHTQWRIDADLTKSWFGAVGIHELAEHCLPLILTHLKHPNSLNSRRDSHLPRDPNRHTQSHTSSNQPKPTHQVLFWRHPPATRNRPHRLLRLARVHKIRRHIRHRMIRHAQSAHDSDSLYLLLKNTGNEEMTNIVFW